MAAIQRFTKRAWAARLGLLIVVGALVGLVVAIVPVLASSGSPIPPASGAGVTPIEVNLGGQNNDCSASEVGLGNLYDFRIEDPDGVYTDNQSGFAVTFTVNTYRVAGEEFMDFSVTGASVEGLVIKGGTNSAFYAYATSVGSDTKTHATRKTNGKLHQVSHASFCYDVVGTISGTKFHDNDTDGRLDPTEESVLSGWQIAAFDSNGALVGDSPVSTDSFGDYTISDVPLGQTYTVCEATNTVGLPNDTTNVVWAWTQSDLTLNSSQYPDWISDDPDGVRGPCFGFANQEPGGHQFVMNASVDEIDFGNHREVSVTCDPNDDVVVTLGGDETLDDPLATITFEAGCGSTDFTSSFDVGRSNDGDEWDQFVVFGGDPDGSITLTQKIEWDAETAVHRDSNGALCDPTTNADCSLVVPTTLVRLAPGGQLQPVQFCSDLGGGPTDLVWQCLDSRMIAQGGQSLGSNEVQLTEIYLVFGDPSNFR